MPNVDDYVFHYCSAATLFAIVTKRELWASDIRYMNDRYEGELVKNTLREIIVGHTTHAPSAQRKHLEALSASFNSDELTKIVCFSRHASFLPMFQLYAPASAGFAIGFERHFLSTLGTLIDCTYSRDEIWQWSNAYAADFFAACGRLDKPGLTAEELTILVLNSTDLLARRIQASWRFKHPDFLYEAEVRLIASQGHEEFRVLSDGRAIVPFTRMSIPNDESVSVWLTSGPSREPSFAYGTLGAIQRVANSADTKWSFLQAWNSFSKAFRN